MQNIKEVAVDGAVVLDDAGEWYMDYLVVVDTYHDIAETLAECLDAGCTHTAGDDAVVGCRVTTTLEVTEDGDADIKVGILGFDHVGIVHGTACLFVGCYEYDARLLGLAESRLDEVVELLVFYLEGWYDGFFTSAGDTAVEGKESCAVAHDLNEEEAFVGGGCVANLIDYLHDGVEGCVVADGGVGADEVVVDGGRDGDAREVELLGEDTSALDGSVTADDDECVDACILYVLECLLASFLRLEVFGWGGLEDGSSLLYDVAHAV